MEAPTIDRTCPAGALLEGDRIIRDGQTRTVSHVEGAARYGEVRIVCTTGAPILARTGTRIELAS